MTGHHPWDELMRKHYTPEERERMLEEARRELEEEERRERAPDGRKVAAEPRRPTPRAVEARGGAAE